MPRVLLAGLAGVAIAAIAIGAASASNRAAPSSGAVTRPGRTSPSTRAASQRPARTVVQRRRARVRPRQLRPRCRHRQPLLPAARRPDARLPGMKDGQTQRDVVKVTARTRMIEGVLATAVSDIAKHRKTVLERTTDYYAQDKLGNVWYLGEATVSFGPHGKRDTSGSWMAGVNGAIPGLIMEADPRIPDAYRQELPRRARPRTPPGSSGAEARSWCPSARSATSCRPSKPRASSRAPTTSRCTARGSGSSSSGALSGPPEVAKLVRVTGP